MKEGVFPRLSAVANTVLCMPATSTLSERNISSSGLVASHQRAALKPENVDAIIFLNRNTVELFGMKALGPDEAIFVKKEPDVEGAEEDEPPLPSLSLEQSWEDV